MYALEGRIKRLCGEIASLLSRNVEKIDNVEFCEKYLNLLKLFFENKRN